MYKRTIKQACATKAFKRPLWKNIVYDPAGPEGARYIATNGHILFVELTSDTAPEGEAVYMPDNFPPVDDLIKDTREGCEPITVPDQTDASGKLTILNDYEALSTQYLGICARFAGKGWKLYKRQSDLYMPLYFESADGKRFGCIMPIRR